MMGLSDRLNPTCLLTERRRGEQPTHSGLSLTLFFLLPVHMPLSSYLPLNGGRVPRLQASHVIQGQVKASSNYSRYMVFP